MAKKIKTDEFRKERSKRGQGHPRYIYEKVGNEFKYIGITHEEKTRGNNGELNIKLDKNPNPNDKRTAYAQPYPSKANKKQFGKKENWKLAESDKPKIETIKKRKKKIERRKLA